MDNFQTFDLHFEDLPEEIKKERKILSRTVTALTLSAIISYSLLFLMEFIIYLFFPSVTQSSWFLLGINDFFSLCVLGIFALFTMKIPAVKPVEMTKMTLISFLGYICASIAIMVAGSMIGNFISELVGSIFNREVENVVSELVAENGTWQLVVFVVITGPILEELIFRKLLIDKLSRYGSKFSISLSAILFGLFHGNFYQFFYAAGIGIILGYIYVTCGKIRYSIILHMILNFLGSVVPVYLEKFSQSTNQILQNTTMIYSISYLLTIPLGVMFIIKEIKNSKFYLLDGVLVKPSKMLPSNFGLIFFGIYIVSIFILNIIFV